MDNKDIKILNVMKQNARLSIQQIAKRCMLPITTVYNRIKRMEAAQIITGYTVIVDKRKLGRLIDAFVLATVDYKELKKDKTNQEGLAKRIKQMPEVEMISIMAGETDLILKLSVGSMEELNSFVVNKLRNVAGIDRTKTLVVLKDTSGSFI